MWMPLSEKKREMIIMKTKKLFTANLRPGMIVAESVYTYNGRLIIQENTELTPDIISKLKHYAIKTVYILVNDSPQKLKTPTIMITTIKNQHTLNELSSQKISKNFIHNLIHVLQDLKRH